MSSFGSSLINKGKKVVPKAAARRRPAGAASSLAAQSDTASVVSARSSLEPSQTPQPEPLGRDSVPPPGLPTPEVTQVAIEQTTAHDGIPTIQSSGPPRDSARLEQAAREASVHTDPDTIPLVAISGSASVLPTPTDTQLRHASPVVQITGPAKRRRLDNESVPARAPTPPAPARITQPVDEDEIPVIQVSKTPPRSLSKPSKAVAAAKRKRAEKDGLVEYETPEPPPPAEPSTSSARRRASRPAIAPLLMATINGPKPRAKGTRRQTWQITTPGDLAAHRAREMGTELTMEDLGITAEDEANGVEMPRLRKIRKDKGIKKGPMRYLDDDEDDEDFAPETNGSRSTRTRPARAGSSAVDSAGTRGRAIAPHPGPTGAGTSEDAESEEPNRPTSAASARLRNAQKRKAKQIAARGGQSQANGIDAAAAIDDAIAPSVEGRGGRAAPKGRGRNPLLRVQSQDSLQRERSTSVGSDATEVTVSEGGTTTKKRSRYKRRDTPPGNETVFIAEKVTPMLSLVGRDTENRVGQRSITEMRMRNVDWKEVKAEHAERMRQAAFAKGNRKTNNFDVIFGRTETPVFETAATPASADGSLDEGDELDAIMAQREKNYGPSKHMEAVMVNGEHRLVEGASRIRTAREEIDSQMGDDEPAEENDLKKQRFNVHSFIKFKRKDPAERVYQSARWTDEETEKFYDALRCVGVDFGSMAEWFPNRIRRSLKRKFNIEERANPHRINEALDAHMSMLASGDAAGWDMAEMKDNGIYELKDPREVEEELQRIRKEREVEIEAARKEYEDERRNQKLAGVQHSDDEEEEEEYEEVEVEVDEDEEEEELDPVAKVQKEMMEKKRQKLEEATGVGAERDGEDGSAVADDEEEEDDDDEPMLENEQVYEEGAGWDDSGDDEEE